MRSKPISAGILTALLLAIPAAAQTTAELLQRGIFSQETEGNLDNAIAIYRQIVQSSSPQRDLVAQAQLRLGQALLQKGSLDLAAAEFQRLSRDFADQQAVISRMAAQMRPSATHDTYGLAPAAALLRDAEMRKRDIEVHSMDAAGGVNHSTFDAGHTVTVQGTVSQVMFMNPTGILGIVSVEARDSGTKYFFALAAANALIRQGMNRESLKLGQVVTVTGVLADDGAKLPNGEIVAKANTVTAQDGTLVWDRARPLAPQQALQEDQVKAAMQQLERARAALAAQSGK